MADAMDYRSASEDHLRKTPSHPNAKRCKSMQSPLLGRGKGGPALHKVSDRQRSLTGKHKHPHFALEKF